MFLSLLILSTMVCVPAVTGDENNLARERQRALSRIASTCEIGACYPSSGDLLIGRESRLFASSTCGSKNRERYCDISNLRSPKCSWCETDNNTIGNLRLNHGIQNVIYKYLGTRGDSWWQSENGKEDVSIRLDLEAKFHVEQLIINFKTFRPRAMFVERSSDFGRTWRVYRYFAYNCTDAFPGVPVKTTSFLTDVVCEEYSGITTATGGEVHNFRFLPHNVSPYSVEGQNFLRSTNLRIKFTKLHTIGNYYHNYYAIEKMRVLGSCSCNGHASSCLPLWGIDSNVNSNMVHGRCKCVHNTHGLNCEYCKRLFNDLPWQPAAGKKTNACKKCTCHNHASKCHFNAAAYIKSGRVRGGVCDNCQYNTMGMHCERCRPNFFKDPNLGIQDPYMCSACDCDPVGVVNKDVMCDNETDILNNKTAGRCLCKVNVDGSRCDNCRIGFWNLDIANPHGCEECTCNKLGTISCDPFTSMCFCKRYVMGRKCDRCLSEFYGLSDSEYGCAPCDCDRSGSLNTTCDVITGQCPCLSNERTGRRCDQFL